MNAKLFTLFAIIAFAFTACSEKDLYEENESPKKVGDLNIPLSFDWSMTKTVACNFTSLQEVEVKVYLNERCNQNDLIAEYILLPGMEPLELSVMNSVSKLYVKAGDDATPQAVTVDANGVAKIDIAPQSRVLTRSKETLPGEFRGNIYFPHYYVSGTETYDDTWATIMFEDNFPVKGDYDFNDFVAYYRYTADLSRKQGGGNDETYWKYHVKALSFDVRVVALGGLYPYQPYLQLIGMKHKEFTTNGPTLVSDKNNALIVALENSTRPEGAAFLNTKPGETKVAESALKTQTFTVIANNSNGTGVPQHKLKFDFYLQGKGQLGNGQTLEIHQKGFEPINKNAYPNGFGLRSGEDYYSTADNFVWAISVPKKIKHATETTDFLKAYPRFAEWATDGEKRSLAWYESGNDKYLFQMEK